MVSKPTKKQQIHWQHSCHCHLWPEQPIEQSETGFTAHYFLPILSLGEQRKQRNNDEHGWEVNTGCIVLQMHFLGIFGVATPGATLLSVIGRLEQVIADWKHEKDTFTLSVFFTFSLNLTTWQKTALSARLWWLPGKSSPKKAELKKQSWYDKFGANSWPLSS